MGRKRSSHKELSLSEAEVEITRLLTESGKKEELRERLLDKLADSGWKDQVLLALFF